MDAKAEWYNEGYSAGYRDGWDASSIVDPYGWRDGMEVDPSPAPPAGTGRDGRDALAVIREAQERLYSSPRGAATNERIIKELDEVANALALLPDLHAQVSRRLDVLFPKEG